MNFSFRDERGVGVCACPGVDVGHCQGRMFNIKSGAGTLKWLGPPRTPLIPGPVGAAVAIVALVIYYLEASPRSRTTPVFDKYIQMYWLYSIQLSVTSVPTKLCYISYELALDVAAGNWGIKP